MADVKVYFDTVVTVCKPLFSWTRFGVGRAKVRVVHERHEAVGGFLLSPRASQDSTASFQVALCC